MIIILLGLMNMSGAGLVGKAEAALVAFKLFILSILIIAGLDNIASHSTIQEGQAITTLTNIDWTTTFGSVGLTFFAYAGYGMMANTAGNLKTPQKTLPRAIFLAIGIVILLYVALSFIVLKNVPTSELKTHVDTAVAQTARPLLGKWGDIAISIAALVASASAINATMFSFLRISQGLAAKHQLDTAFQTPLWRQGSKGFVLTLGGILIITNLFNLAAIANIASTTFLICYLAVFVAHWKLRQETRTNGAPIIIGFLLMLGILIAFLRQIYVTQAPALVVIVLFIIVSFILERWIRKSSKRAMKHIPPPAV
ncbi:MAG: APC family permease [Akkermansia sp.]